jgi:hypothetical protein
MLLSMPNLSETAADLRRARDRLTERRYELDRASHTLQQQMAEVEAAIAALDTVLVQASPPDSAADLYYQGPDGLPVAVQVKPRKRKDAPASVRTAITRLLSSERRPFETAEVVERVAEFGAVEVQAATTRSILAKMHKSGEVQQVKRGLYRIARRDVFIASSSDPAIGVDPAQATAGRVWVPTSPTPAEFMALPPHPEDNEPEPAGGNRPVPTIEAAQGRLDQQVDREDGSS